MDAIAQLYATHPMWAWIALGAGLLAVEILTGSGWLLWAAASAGVVGLGVRLAGLSFAQAVLVFAVLTMASTLLARRYLGAGTAQAGDINDNVGRLVGRQGVAVGAFAGGAGRVFIDGKEWAAELEGAESLAAGAAVEVVAVMDGAHLKVRAA